MRSPAMLRFATLLLCSLSIARADDKVITVAAVASGQQVAAAPVVDPCASVGLRSCLGVCTNTLTDPLNCGGCGKTCPINPNSQAGLDVCVQGALNFAYVELRFNATMMPWLCQRRQDSTVKQPCSPLAECNCNLHPCCYLISSWPPSFTGKCKKECLPGSGNCVPNGCAKKCTAPINGTVYCYKSKCVSVCSTGLQVCGNRCTSTQTDSLNCGACGTVRTL
jgi:hypothetical protein